MKHNDVCAFAVKLARSILQTHVQSFKRDEDRWNQMEEKQKKEDEDWRRLREDGSKAKKNQSNVAYDIMTLQYSQDQDGQQQKYLDDMGKLFTVTKLHRQHYVLVLISYQSALFYQINSEISSDPAYQHACCERRHTRVVQHY